MLQLLRLKAYQYMPFKTALLEDKNTIGAAIKDNSWGSGISSRMTKALKPDHWPGQNKLGKLMMKLREDMKPTERRTELQPLQDQEEDNYQQKDDPLEESESLEPPSTPQTININNGDIVDSTPTTTTTSPERDTTSNQESNRTPECKSRPQFKVSQIRNRAKRSGTVPTRYTEYRSESCDYRRFPQKREKAAVSDTTERKRQQ